MSTESMDRRVRKTRRQLRECLISLLKEKKVQDITVRELTDMADLNRGTFYLHYKDVFDLLEKTETELQDEFNQLVLKHDAVDLKQRPAVIFNEIYTLVYENADLIEILLGENGDLNFVNRLKQLIREKCLKYSAPATRLLSTHSFPLSCPAAWALSSTGCRQGLRKRPCRWPG